ncbi:MULTISPECIES: hypothetical protein [Flavobacteriaceae]|uniref:hypothetical protein n=1 Tax=Flavobacteriaceae TaxID=49546 RepID=UPI0014931ECA|nr:MULTISPECIES: hypothetical protein [Allomuricauda]MDC6366837.1 hypothetical protein [Muricauda sp. AC10]
MNNQKTILLIAFLLLQFSVIYSQEDGDYVTFNDRTNIVHGVYLGLNTHLGDINDEPAYFGGLKLAYVANKQFEVGLEGILLYSQQSIPRAINDDLIGGYGGLHLEPIFFGNSQVSLSFPLLIGGGALGYLGNTYRETTNIGRQRDDVDAIFVLEPGANLLFNVSRYLQLEAGVKYRFSSKVALEYSTIDRLNGFSAGIGIKLGVFNLGRNRYKKKLS